MSLDIPSELVFVLLPVIWLVLQGAGFFLLANWIKKPDRSSAVS